MYVIKGNIFIFSSKKEHWRTWLTITVTNTPAFYHLFKTGMQILSSCAFFFIRERHSPDSFLLLAICSWKDWAWQKGNETEEQGFDLISYFNNPSKISLINPCHISLNNPSQISFTNILLRFLSEIPVKFFSNIHHNQWILFISNMVESTRSLEGWYQ